MHTIRQKQRQLSNGNENNNSSEVCLTSTSIQSRKSGQDCNIKKNAPAATALAPISQIKGNIKRPSPVKHHPPVLPQGLQKKTFVFLTFVLSLDFGEILNRFSSVSIFVSFWPFVLVITAELDVELEFGEFAASFRLWKKSDTA